MKINNKVLLGIATFAWGFAGLAYYNEAKATEVYPHAEVTVHEVLNCMDEVRGDKPDATGFTFHLLDDENFEVDYVVPIGSTFERFQEECPYERE